MTAADTPTAVTPVLPLFYSVSPPAPAAIPWRTAVVSTLGEVDDALARAGQMGYREREVIAIREDNFQVRWR